MYKRFEKAEDLPEEWDASCKDNMYLKRIIGILMCSRSIYEETENMEFLCKNI